MKPVFQTRRYLIIQTISYLYILLFVYAAVSKLLEFEDYRIQLAQSPMLSAYAGALAWLVPLLEILTAFLFFFNKTRPLGLLCGFVIMIAFSTYIYIILHYSSFIPCSCGGIIEKLGWTEHLIFNLFFVFLAIIGWLLTKPLQFSQRRTFKTTLILAFLGLLGILTVTLLYISSERIIYTENPFIRRYFYGVMNTAETDLGDDSYYFAGVSDSTVFLGNYNRRLNITLIDTALETKNNKTITVSEDDLPSIASQIRVDHPRFYLIDGQISRVLKGNTLEWKAAQRFDGTISFSNFQVTDKNKIVFRTFIPGKPVQTLGYLSITDSLPFKLVPGLLTKQVDGNFDADGILNYDQHSGNVVYTYYYRNSFFITDSLLVIQAMGSTIDTIKRVQLMIDTISEAGQKVLISAMMVNASAFASNGLLYVKSKIKGRYQPEKTWKQTETIDVYEIQTGNYRASFYVYKVTGEPVRQFFVSGNSFYGLTGNSLVRYNLESLLEND